MEANQARSFRLKFMVMVRLLAETTMLTILLILPLILLSMSKLWVLPLVGRVVVFGLSALSLLVLPWYGFVTWKVRVDQMGLTAFTAFGKHTVAWSEARSLKRKINFKYPRYVVKADQKDVSFPIWMENLETLLEIIQTHLPGGSESDFNPFRQFRHEVLALALLILSSLASLAMLVVFWMFFVVYAGQKAASQFDIGVLLIFCLTLSGILLWRTFVVLMMPVAVEVTAEQVIVRTLFFERKMPWIAVTSVKKSLPLLPEGFVIATSRGSYLIGLAMDESDALERSLREVVLKREDPSGGTECDIKENGEA